MRVQFRGGHAVLGRAEQIDRIKPELQRRPAVGERRARRRVEMMTAPLAGEGAFGFEAIPAGSSSAFRAAMSLSIPDREDVVEASLIVGEHLEELPQRDDAIHQHAGRIITTRTVWQRDSAERSSGGVTILA